MDTRLLNVLRALMLSIAIGLVCIGLEMASVWPVFAAVTIVPWLPLILPSQRPEVEVVPPRLFGRSFLLLFVAFLVLVVLGSHVDALIVAAAAATACGMAAHLCLEQADADRRRARRRAHRLPPT